MNTTIILTPKDMAKTPKKRTAVSLP